MTHDLGSLAGIVAFLVAMMVLAQACADEGLFDALGGRVARRAAGSSRRLLIYAVALAAVVTAVLSLDATVVLLTPVLIAAAPRRAYAFASVRLANSASTLLPVSNLTNLLVFASTGLTFLGFTWAMLPVWVVAVLAEFLVLRLWFAKELRIPSSVPEGVHPVPLFPVAVVIVVLLALASGTTPWVPATAGAILVGVHALVRRETTWRSLLDAANLPLAAVILAWAFAVAWLESTPWGDRVTEALPSGTGLGALLVFALVAMVVANLINNLPATLLLLPAAAAAGPAAILALLVGVNVGANLTLIGSVANVLWRSSGGRTVSSVREFHLLGLATTPVLVVGCTVVLWAWTSLIW
ncbi:SLC13 family permease [Aeromicrobium wangtongii]|uniref:SLC13 family permease n=1 Tax=Aeromicrobium wangtongii TaxID=2969247 RepID=A0ABY5MCR1_9ACTN|nr:SLC13 family permease [Aeromicrobium wangtongii]MCD9197419.1 arsenic transporter [Aeromicrobium wangtongii]UUP14913.1 SLC13 family permease [Aeromicrobium wangtongii]